MINYDLKKIRAVVFDVDGVLSGETVSMGPDGEPLRTVNMKDGYVIQLAVKLGLHIAIITGERDENIRRRFEYLGVKDIFLNCSRKIKVWNELMQKYGLLEEEMIYVGDDIPDRDIMLRAGCACCPKDACIDIKAVSDYVSDRIGGHGVGRDIIEQVLRAQGKWMTSSEAFGW